MCISEEFADISNEALAATVIDSSQHLTSLWLSRIRLIRSRQTKQHSLNLAPNHPSFYNRVFTRNLLMLAIKHHIGLKFIVSATFASEGKLAYHSNTIIISTI